MDLLDCGIEEQMHATMTSNKDWASHLELCNTCAPLQRQRGDRIITVAQLESSFNTLAKRRLA